MSRLNQWCRRTRHDDRVQKYEVCADDCTKGKKKRKLRWQQAKTQHFEFPFLWNKISVWNRAWEFRIPTQKTQVLLIHPVLVLRVWIPERCFYSSIGFQRTVWRPKVGRRAKFFLIWPHFYYIIFIKRGITITRLSRYGRAVLHNVQNRNVNTQRNLYLRVYFIAIFIMHLFVHIWFAESWLSSV